MIGRREVAAFRTVGGPPLAGTLRTRCPLPFGPIVVSPDLARQARIGVSLSVAPGGTVYDLFRKRGPWTRLV